MLAAGAAALIAGCSDASRFAADPFSDPFQPSSRGVDRAPTGSIDPPPRADAGQVQSRPLPPPASAAAAPASAPKPVAQAPSAAGSYNHWSAEGGTPIVVAQGETANMLANRYGVPADALLRVNGFANASQVQPGARLVIPVYRATAAKPAAPATAKAEEVASPKPAPVKTANKPEAKPAPSKSVKSEDNDATPAAKRPRKGADASGADKSKIAKAEDIHEAPPPPKAKETHAEQKPAPAKMNVAKAEIKSEQKPEPKVEAKAAKPERIARAAAEKQEPAPAKVAMAEKPAVSAPPAAAREVDKTPIASIPPAREEKREEKSVAASADAHPEFRWPARGRIIQGFNTGGNDGINISVPEGTQVKAAEGGVVAYAGNELKGYGNLVLIRHPNGFVSAYAHNGEIAVKRGDNVTRGQTIAKSGQSGNVGAPQLHFELRKGSTPVDPTSYLAGL
jgi:murein DD-endopeptidase MepM/ murein hydrolase activator NlpD